MSVIIKIPLNRTDVYHTETCNNVQAMANKREVSKAQAEEFGLRPCKTCTDQLGGSLEYDNSAQRVLKDSNTIAELQEALND